jgi:hypothetical protein
MTPMAAPCRALERALSSDGLRCRRCGSPEVGRSHRRPWEYPLSWFGVLPYRCLCCLARFYNPRRAPAATTRRIDPTLSE